MAQENKMGTMPVGKLLFSMALPMMASMLVQALYNIVDSIFVSRLSQDALTAVSLAFPMQNLMIAVAAGIGVGMNALLSRKLGEKKHEEANQVADNGILIYIVAYLLFLLIGLFAVKPFLRGMTDIHNILDLGYQYLTIVTCASFGCFTQFCFERMLQSTGKTFYAMITQGTGAIINMILDPIMIFGYFGCPKMGIAGAAVATVTGQVVAGILAIYFNLRRNKEIHISSKEFRLDLALIRNILYIGIPSVLMVAIGSLMTFGMNRILMGFTATAVAVFGAYFKLQSFIFMPIFGLNNGMIPIIAYNYGAAKKDRIMKTIKLSVISAVCIMCVGFLIFQVAPAILLGFFNASEEMLSIGIPALRIISVSFIFAGYSIVSSSVFQAFGNGIWSLIISFMRQLVVLLPVAFFMARTGNINMVWLSWPIAELMSVALCTYYLIRTNQKIISQL
ncbi:MAG: MATE family efflux transporter [Eubacteriales bacterium]|nr:MATE family efflux transporter [Eubacteriales bacterium]